MVNKFNKVDIHFKACHNTIKKILYIKQGKICKLSNIINYFTLKSSLFKYIIFKMTNIGERFKDKIIQLSSSKSSKIIQNNFCWTIKIYFSVFFLY